MKFTTAQIVGLAAALSSTAAADLVKGFNYGSTDSSNQPITQSQYEDLFKTAEGLKGTAGFTSARLYTMIQAGTPNSPIEAIPAAIAQNTKLLLGLWASAGQDQFNQELTALKSAIDTYGSQLGDLLLGISVGSEDLYRDSIMGIQANAGIGAGPDVILSYIKQVKQLISGTALANTPITHVDTWTAWVNGSNADVVSSIDFVSVDLYPYFQNTMANSIDVAKNLFWDAIDQTQANAQGKDIWVTETGWPVSGPNENQAVASLANAKTYWDEVGCDIFTKMNTFWYTLQDASPVTPSPSFGVVGSQLSTTPLFDLTCPAGSSSSSSSSSSSAAATSSSSSADPSSSAAATSTEATTSSSDPASSSAAASTPSSSAAAAATASSAAVSADDVAKSSATSGPASTSEAAPATSSAAAAVSSAAPVSSEAPAAPSTTTEAAPATSAAESVAPVESTTAPVATGAAASVVASTLSVLGLAAFVSLL
ncbi:Bgl2p [Sugiyamaella lignohabitans]|uniref:Probable glucan endo-1,3-beta-glucosidase eglC n=1 Tax=Sugiyamaella lignohabitans TaxID=796027 RepID=A0A161HKJ0_9ASCO|nr:Bgl2p [Sugiyamaella lignohabitans]ANB12238.1 Bgl2p [Sugiyamaella lignohabitans]